MIQVSPARWLRARRIPAALVPPPLTSPDRTGSTNAALSAPSAGSIPLTSFSGAHFAGASPTDHNASTSSSSSSSSATHSLAPLVEAADYSTSSNFFGGTGQFDSDAPAASGTGGAYPEYDVNNGLRSGDGDISVEFQLQQQQQAAEPAKPVKGKGKGKGKSVEKNGGGNEDGADGSGGDTVKPLKDTSEFISRFPSAMKEY